jgi:predicted N-acetyltransferase YhbS
MIAIADDPVPLIPSPPNRQDGGAAFVVADECDDDRIARERLLDAAFGLARNEKTCQRLREARFPADRLALIARQGGDLVGTIRLWNIWAGDRAALLLGPLAVAASHRRCGIGARLMHDALDRAQAAGHRAIILVGDPEYYQRFGFDRALTQQLELPGPVEPHRFLGLELQSAALAGASGRVTAAGRLQSNNIGRNRRNQSPRRVRLPNWSWPNARLVRLLSLESV